MNRFPAQSVRAFAKNTPCYSVWRNGKPVTVQKLLRFTPNRSLSGLTSALLRPAPRGKQRLRCHKSVSNPINRGHHIPSPESGHSDSISGVFCWRVVTDRRDERNRKPNNNLSLSCDFFFHSFLGLFDCTALSKRSEGKNSFIRKVVKLKKGKRNAKLLMMVCFSPDLLPTQADK